LEFSNFKEQNILGFVEIISFKNLTLAVWPGSWEFFERRLVLMLLSFQANLLGLVEPR
jgi:hypothetical protein